MITTGYIITKNHTMSNAKPIIMGIINLTPDSFSDGGKYNTEDSAIRQALKLEEEGADILDLGAEASGPNSKDITITEEINRLIPILKKIRKYTSLKISIDTYKSQLADLALKEGADYINDITAFRGDKQMAKTIAHHKAKSIIMYSKDPTARTTITKKSYKNVIKTISTFLKARLKYAENNGLDPSSLIIDPGMGHYISSIPKYSYEIIARLQEIKETFEQPILIGISRKSLLGGSLQNRDQRGLPLTAIAYLNGASIIRTHSVKSTKEFLNNLT